MPIHTIAPVYDGNSRILILGSFPSVRSREEGFYYAHPQNRFWSVLSEVFAQDLPRTTDEKKTFLLRNRVALFDVAASCEIFGSADSTIKEVVPNDLSPILSASPIEAIFANGKTAESFYKKYQEKATGIKAIVLPSTSPANAAWSFERLVEEWKIIKE